MSWSQAVFGWPTIVLAVGLFGLGFRRERSMLGFVGVAAAVPFLWYLSHGSVWIASAFFVLLGAAAVLLVRGRRRWAAACFVPFASYVLVLAVGVLMQGWLRGR